MNHCQLEDIIRRIKFGDRSGVGPFRDDSKGADKVFVTNIINLAEKYEITLSPLQVAALQLPNTEASLSCFTWLKSFFETVGDHIPTVNEIHLDPQSVRSVHNEYVIAMTDARSVRNLL
jgi:hypothetical protein